MNKNNIQETKENTSQVLNKAQVREVLPEAFHPAYTSYVVPPDPVQPPKRHPRAVHIAQPAPVSYALLRQQNFFVMKRSLDEPERDKIVIGKAIVFM